MKIFDKLMQSFGRGTLPGESARIIVPWLIERFGPTSVADVGCGNGAWLHEFKKYHCKILGYDRIFAKDSMISREEFALVNLNYGMIPGVKIDLALCLETAEHIRAGMADTLVLALTSVAPVVIFSAAIPGQGGWWHLNEQWPEYWILKFKAKGFDAYEDLRTTFWADKDLPVWYRQNVIIFARPETAIKYKLTYMGLMNIINPDMWLHTGLMGIWKRLNYSYILAALFVLIIYTFVVFLISKQ